MSQLFTCGLKSKEIFLFFPSIFVTLDSKFERFLFCFNNIRFFSLFSSLIGGFWKQRRTNFAWGKKEIQFFWKGKLRFFFDLNNIIWFVTWTGLVHVSTFWRFPYFHRYLECPKTKRTLKDFFHSCKTRLRVCIFSHSIMSCSR